MYILLASDAGLAGAPFSHSCLIITYTKGAGHVNSSFKISLFREYFTCIPHAL